MVVLYFGTFSFRFYKKTSGINYTSAHEFVLYTFQFLFENLCGVNVFFLYTNSGIRNRTFFGPSVNFRYTIYISVTYGFDIHTPT